MLKNRIHSTLISLGRPCPVTDLFGVEGRELLAKLEVPEPWRGNVTASLALIDSLEMQIGEVNNRLKEGHADHPYERQPLLSVPSADLATHKQRPCRLGWRRGPALRIPARAPRSWTTPVPGVPMLMVTKQHGGCNDAGLGREGVVPESAAGIRPPQVQLTGPTPWRLAAAAFRCSAVSLRAPRSEADEVGRDLEKEGSSLSDPVAGDGTQRSGALRRGESERPLLV